MAFFQREFVFMINRKANGHTAEYLKRQAKNLKKQFGITYLQALDKAAISAGFTGWNNFVNKSSSISKAKPKKAAKVKLLVPLVLQFHLVLSNVKISRPNARMPIDAHKEVGAILKILKNATEHNKRACRPITDIAFMLDEWAQKEYTDRKELSDAVFFDLYYGNEKTPAETAPSAQRKMELQALCNRVKSILKKSYHDCKPVRDLLSKADLAIKWIDGWPGGYHEPKFTRKDALLSTGSIVMVKHNKMPAVLINHDRVAGMVDCYTDAGPMTTSRKNIIVPKNQSKAENFVPMRLWLPYGKSFQPDGKQILFNRDYTPIWVKLQNGDVETIAPTTRMGDSDKEFFFNDGSAPWHNDKNSQVKCIEALKAWGVESQPSVLMGLLQQAIETNDISILKPRH